MNSGIKTTINLEDIRWQVLVERDQQAGGGFYYAVKTTGIYCRPTCKSRLPLRENVVFFDTWQEAETAGYRPCKRCRPQDAAENAAHHKSVIDACRMIDESETVPSLENLARTAGLSPFHFQRVFKKVVGITPKQYFMQKRSNKMKNSLEQNRRVLDGIYDAGFGSTSPFYRQATGSLGMKPSDFKKGAAGIAITYSVSQSYLGWVLVAATDVGICAIEFGECPKMLEERLLQRFPQANCNKGDTVFASLVTEVLSYLELPDKDFNLPLDIMGTAFQRRVWMALREIPSGSIVSYADLAKKIGKPSAVRAVANACAANKIAAVIPCHRVVRSDGGLGGYRWGIERKRKLLEREHKSEVNTSKR
jgi:AraC family transcriptional regulator of adaptative response/methylated-DNA-[protein]-cysteine methyltransferase